MSEIYSNWITDSGSWFLLDPLGAGDPTVAITGTGESVPRGLEAYLQYSGLILGDTTKIDCYFITSIEGLADADIRDSRENLPSSHGEEAFDAYYGGRTIVINGFIRAFNMAKLRDMQQALRTAFSELTEKALYFRTPNEETDHYIMCRKSQPIQWSEVQKNHNYFRDFQITLRAGNPRFVSVTEHSAEVYPNLIDNPSFETDTPPAAPADWTLSNPDAYTSTQFITKSFSGGHGDKGIQFGGTKPNNATEDILGATTQIGDASQGVTPGELYKLMSYTEITAASAAPASRGIRASIDWYTSGDVYISSDDGTLVASGTTHAGDILASGAAPATARYAVARVEAVSVTALDVITVSIGDARFFRVNPDTANDDASGGVIITNNGNFPAQPRIRFNGPLSNVEIHNETNEQHMALASAVVVDDDPGDYYELDTINRTLKDQEGTSVFGDLDFTSDMIELEAGDNEIVLEADTKGDDNNPVEIFWRDTWI